MKLETRRAALRAAQAVAGLVVGTGVGPLLVACSPAPPPEAATVPASDVPNKPLAPASSSLAGSSGASGSGSLGPPGTCPATVERFFPGTDDPYVPNLPSNHIKAPADVERCCLAALNTMRPTPGAIPIPQADADRLLNTHRWRCCNAVDPTRRAGEAVGMACTPWGPPVPPPMRRRAAIA